MTETTAGIYRELDDCYKCFSYVGSQGHADICGSFTPATPKTEDTFPEAPKTGTERATEHAESLAEMCRKRTEAGSLFGHVNELDEWHDVDECDDHETCNDASGFDYLSDALDFDYIIGSDRKYKAARIMVGMGGPNVWLNTLTEAVEVSWWSDIVSVSLPREFVEALDDAMSELYEMGN